MPKNLIVYFPGYTGMPKSMFNPLLRKFRRDGFTTYSVKYNLFGRGDISDLAKSAVEQISKLDMPRYDSVTFIGHSMGGLVARKTANSIVSPDFLITLGSPHKGVQSALSPFSWIGGHSVLQMRPKSTYSQYLAYPDIPTLAVTGDWDYIVRDGSAVEIYRKGPDPYGPDKSKHDPKNIKIPRTTHLGLITNYRTYGEIYSWLVYEQLDTLNPARNMEHISNNKLPLREIFKNGI